MARPDPRLLCSGADWPKSLDKDHLKLLWHVDLGPGYPGPIVAEDRVFVAETKAEKAEIVRALDRETGRELWKAEWPGAMSVPFMAKRNGDWIRSTPPTMAIRSSWPGCGTCWCVWTPRRARNDGELTL